MVASEQLLPLAGQMSECNWALLPDRGVIRVAGSDAQKFLQGLVTNDVTRTGASGGIYTALLTAQGKIISDFFVIADVDGFLIEAPRDQVAQIAKKLTLYKLRADVTVEALLDEAFVAVQWGSDCPELVEGFWFPDPRHAALGSRIIFDSPDAERGFVDSCAQCGAEDFHAHRISLGIPEGGKDFPFEDVFPHDANFDLIHGVDFKKGCFVGQEVVSRMEHRGTARKRIVCIEALDGALDSGTEVVTDETSIGMVGSISGANGLALVRVDRAADAIKNGQTIYAGSTPILLSSPPYADFALGS